MSRAVVTLPLDNQLSPRASHGVTRVASFLCLSLAGLLLVAPAQAAPMLTLAGGVANPPPNLQSTGLNPKQTAIADKAALVPVAGFTPILQATLDAQGFTNKNNWTVVNNMAPLDNKATFNVTAYNLSLNGGGTAFGETMDFTLDPNLAQPANLPAGSEATLHWMQVLNEDQKYGNFGYAIAGQQGFWQLDNGDKPGGLAAGPTTGPYYDSNPVKGKTFSTPPTFHDFPSFYAGIGTYLHFTVFPTWDVFTPAQPGVPATESMYVGNYGVSWGFSMVPEPSSVIMLSFGFVAIIGVAWKLRRQPPGIP